MPCFAREALAAVFLVSLISVASAVPVNPNVTIAGGADYATLAQVALALSAGNTTASTNCTLSNDGSSWSGQMPYSASASWNLTAGDGAKTVYYRCSDDGENWSSVASDGIVMDTGPPNITTVSPANGSVTDSVRPSVLASVSDAGSGINASATAFKFDGSTVSASYGPGSVSYSPPADLPEGAHAADVTVYDNLGNSAHTNWSFTVDKLPVIGNAYPASGAMLKSGSFTISASISDTGTGVNATTLLLKVDDTNVTGNSTYSSGTLSYSASLGEGSHSVYVEAYDGSGNKARLNWSFAIDKTEPSISSLAPPDGSESIRVSSVSAAVSDSVSGVNRSALRMKVDSKDVSAYAAYADGVYYFLPNKLSGGNHTAEIWADDNAGNSAFSSWSFSVFSKEPLVDLLSPPDGSSTNATTPKISARVTDSGTSGLNLKSLRLYLDGSDVTSQASYDNTTRVASYTPPSGLSEGNHTARLVISDNLDNAEDRNWSFTIDTSAPQKPANLAVAVSGGKASLSWDATAGAISYNVYRSASPATSLAGFAKLANVTAAAYSDASAAGKLYYAVTAADAAGNEGEPVLGGTCSEYRNGWVDYACCADTDCGAGRMCNTTSHSCYYPSWFVSRGGAEAKLDGVRAELDAARKAGKNVTSSEDLLNQAADAYNSGNYSLAVDLAGQAQLALSNAPLLNQTAAAGAQKKSSACGSAFILLGALAIAAASSLKKED